MTPADENECRQMLYTGFQLNQPAAVRYPRGTGPGAEIRKEMTALPVGKSETRRKGRRVAILAFGSMLAPALEAGEKLDATVVNMRFVKPLDETLLLELARSHAGFVTAEDNAIAGGAGSGVAELLARHGIEVPVLHLGLPDAYLEHASREDLLAEAGIDAAGIRKSVLAGWPELAAATPLRVAAP